MAERIEDYALIGDCETAALVSRSGSIDWLCLPRFDSAAVFAAMVGTPGNGRWLLTPVAAATEVRRRYLPGTLILETELRTADGAVRVIDFMPMRDANACVARLVHGLHGTVRMRMELVLRFDYGFTVPWVTRQADGSLHAIAGPDRVVYRGDCELKGQDHISVGEFSIREGDTRSFSLGHGASHLEAPPAVDVAAALRNTQAGWVKWSGKSRYLGEYHEAVERSLITLKALSYRPTGGIVAAPTTSLPERVGGVRNWDYRYCWLRDATLTLLALMNAGYYEEASEWRSWLERAAAGSPEQLQIMYGVAGERRLGEWEATWLDGYEGSKPVRIGNAAAGQLQLDIYGEVLDALYHAHCGGIPSDAAAWGLQRAFIEHLADIWRQPDEGIWEVRGGRQQFVYSKVMTWVAVDRVIQLVEKGGLEGPLEDWRALRAQIHAEVCEKGFDARRNSFVQRYGGTELDASLLLIPTTGFLPVEDPRVQGTIEAVERELLNDGFVLRYNTTQTSDGLPPQEGVFLACSFWLVDAYLLQGRLDDARRLFERLLALRNDVGLLAEEYDPQARRQVGNFPQAFSHIALINSAFNLSHVDGPATQRPGEGVAAAR